MGEVCRTTAGVLARAFVGVLACLALSGCPGTTGGVTGNDPATAAEGQSETAAASSYVGHNRIVVAFNDETNSKSNITYTPTNRTTLAGASLMGWSYSDDSGTTWMYGGKLSPPKGWAVLWGDPAITSSGANYNTVFLSNLAVPTSKNPAGGIQGYLYYDSGASYIGGACIAKSTDGGAHFAIYQCVSNTAPVGAFPDSTNGHFYDGGSMASNPSGEIYSAYNDVYTANENALFQLMPPPFAGLTVATHPRLRVGQDGSLYVGAVIRTNSNTPLVYLNRFANGTWGRPTQASNPTLGYPLIDLNSSVAGSELTIRAGPQFAFDVGAASTGGNDAIRLLYTRQDNPTNNSPFYIDAFACAADLSNCHPVEGWKIGPSGPNETRLDLFNPDVTAWIGFVGLPPSWQGTFVERYGQSVTSTNLTRMTLGYVNGNALAIPVDILSNTPACSDQRGYLGDYDAMLLTGFQGTAGVYMRFYTNSNAGCTLRWEFVGQQQHVGSVQYQY